MTGALGAGSEIVSTDLPEDTIRPKDSAEARRLSRWRAHAVATFLRLRGVRAIQPLHFSKRYARGIGNPADRRVDVTWG